MRFCLVQLDNMEHKDRIASLVFFVTLLHVYCMVDFVKASIATIDKIVTEKAYSEVHFKTTMKTTATQDASSHMRRSTQEQAHIGHVDLSAEIVGPTQRNVTGPCPNLLVWVPKKPGFTEFVKVNEQSKVEGGFSIAIFCYALQLLPFNVQPTFKPFDGTYNDLVKNIEGKNCEAVAGDVTIRRNRAEYVEFTIPYLSAEVYMLVHAAHEWNQTMWTFLKPFTWRLWVTIVGACIFIGVAVAILEYRAGNPKFVCPFYQKLLMVIWFPISTFFFHEGKLLNRCSKVVLVMWLSMIFIVVQIFTACLSSWLTIDQLHPKLHSSCENVGYQDGCENVGYQDGSFLRDYIIEHCSGKNPLPLKSAEEFNNALSNGSVNAIIDELPYIELFLAKYGSDYMKLGPLNQEAGIAFAFPHGSLLLESFSRAIINVTESAIMMEMKKKYLGFSTDKSRYNQALPQSLDVHSFIGLFIFMGIVTIAAIISSEVSLRRRNREILPLTSMDK